MSLRLLVVGAGPAGASTAIFAQRAGMQVLLLDQQIELLAADQYRFKVGENLPPTAQPLLEELGIWEKFKEQGHLPAYGTCSYWGSQQAAKVDFLHHPLGHGWHLDRQQFEQLLIQQAMDRGAEVQLGVRVNQLDFVERQWRVQLNDQSTATFDYIIDATGRNSWFARQQGGTRLYEFRQLALVAVVEVNDSLRDHTTLIEAIAEGWWYSALLPGKRLVLAFFCQPNQTQRKAWLEPEPWRQLLTKAGKTVQRFATFQNWLIRPQFVAAGSSMLEHKTGPGWCAVGDAAMTFDPVSAHGMTMGMVSARDAVQMLQAKIRGEDGAERTYENILNATFQRYALDRKKIYAAERRFPNSPYWQAAQQ